MWNGTKNLFMQKLYYKSFTDCWPPRVGSMANYDPGVMMGWGIYSPGIVCRAGYTTAALATAGGYSGWGVEFSMTAGETAIACCPRWCASLGIASRQELGN